MERMGLQVNEVEGGMQRLGRHMSPHPQQGGIPSLPQSVDYPANFCFPCEDTRLGSAA